MKEVFKLRTEYAIDSAHFLHGHKGKCSNIHGHRWRIIAEIYSSTLIESGSERGMILDFSTFKSDLKEMLDNYDHSLLIEENTLEPELLALLIKSNFKIETFSFRPTAENLSKFFYTELKNKGYDLTSVTVYETPNNCAVYGVENV